jgi:hypothetical protein
VLNKSLSARLVNEFDKSTEELCDLLVEISSCSAMSGATKSDL